jgi:predicted RNase H-like HicB family nuclease
MEKRLKTKYRDIKVIFTQAEGISEEEAWENLRKAYDIVFKHMQKEAEDNLQSPDKELT